MQNNSEDNLNKQSADEQENTNLSQSVEQADNVTKDSSITSETIEEETIQEENINADTNNSIEEVATEEKLVEETADVEETKEVTIAPKSTEEAHNEAIEPGIESTSNDIVEEDHETEEETTNDEDELLHEKVAYSELSRKEILAHLVQILQETNIDKAKIRFSGIRDAYEQVRKEEVDEQRRKFEESAEEGDEFQEQRDATDNDFYANIKLFQQKLKDHRKQKEAELQKNLKLRLGIIESLKVLLDKTQNISQSFDELHSLQEHWRSIGQVPSNYTEELWKTYQHYINLFYDQIKINKELRELDFKRNLEMKTTLCEKAEELILEPSIKLSLDAYKVLQEEWRNVGQVAKEVNETIWERFKVAGDKLFERRKSYLDEQSGKFTEALQIKKTICEKAEGLIASMPHKSHQEWQKASLAFNDLMEEWKQAGFASKADNDAIWKTFKTIRDQFYDAKENFYKELRKNQTQNLKIKNDICIEAEALKDSTDWKKTTERLKHLQEEWKKVGATSKKQSDKIWARFRNACDAFFNNRKKFFENVDEENAENLKKKQELIERINAFNPGDDYAANLENLKAFQSEWIEIGHVPIKQKDKIQQAYRTAIDAQFSKLRTGNDEQRRQLFKAQVEDLSKNKDGKNRILGQKITLQDKLKRLQSDVHLWENNIGFFSASKNADALLKDFNIKIEKAKKEITLLKEQLNFINSAQNE